MKRTFAYITIIALILISCSKIIIESSAQNNILAKDTKVQNKDAKSLKIDDSIKAVTVKSFDDINIKMIGDTNFNLVVLQSDGVRRADKNYSTDFKALKKLNENVAELERNKLNYFIEVTSGPGFSEDLGLSSIFSSSAQRMYFAQMLREIADKYGRNKYFTGISINLNCPNMDEDTYYSTLMDIMSRVRKQYPDLTFIVNLHPLAFESKLKSIPKLKLQNIIINLPIEISNFSYPGNNTGIISNFELNKNIMLKAFQNLKKSDFKTVMVTLKLPWRENSDVFIQDVFEINKMLGFGSNIGYGNTNDTWDFSKYDSILKLLKRHNQ